MKRHINKYNKEYSPILNRNIWYIPTNNVKYNDKAVGGNDSNENYHLYTLFNDIEIIRPGDLEQKKLYFDLKSLLSRYTWLNKEVNAQFFNYIRKIVADERKSDLEYYEILNEYYNNECSKFDNVDTFDRGKNRSDQIIKILPTNFRPNTYLDVGCYMGDITTNIGNNYSLESKNVYGADIFKYVKNPDFQFSLIEHGKLQFEDNKFDLVTCLMVLHHIHEKDQNIIIEEIYRIMKPGGLLVLREHNFTNSKTLLSLLTIIHDFYDFVWAKNVTWDNYPIYAKYKSNKEWDNLLKQKGFDEINCDNNHNAKVNALNAYTKVYVKSDYCDIK